MKTIYLFCFICFSSVILFAQWQFDTLLPYDSVHSPVVWQICVIDSSVSWAMGNVHINQNYFAPYIARRTSNGWKQIINSDLSDTVCAYTITAKDSSQIWLGTFNNSQDLFYSSNGGVNWILQYHISDLSNVEGIMFSKTYPNLGYVFADFINNNMWSGATILKTTNNGINWYRWDFNLPGYACANGSMCIVDSNYAWFGLDSITGEPGPSKIIMTSTGGLNWNIIDVGGFADGPFTIQFADDKQTGMFVGENNPTSFFYRTTNSGFNWIPVYSINYYYSKTMRWIPGTSNIYGNSEFNIVRSANSGNSWALMWGGPGTNQTSLDAVRINNGKIYALLVTSDRSVYKLIDTAMVIGIRDPGSYEPIEFKLFQNFPNPFNPVTKIKYDLPKSTNVTIKIYDILGREVTTLIQNEFKHAGRYEINWNANNYASGVYFYRIEASSFVSAKKMVLIK